MIPHEFQWREGLGAKVELRTSEAAGAAGEHVSGTTRTRHVPAQLLIKAAGVVERSAGASGRGRGVGVEMVCAGMHWERVRA